MSREKSSNWSDGAPGAFLGLAVGDAMGAPYEFSERGTFEVEDMSGGGPFALPPGAWTDDTSMALCMAESLVERGEMDLDHQMHTYLRWFRHGSWSVTGQCFDIGNTTLASLRAYERTGKLPTHAHQGAAGNGSLVRLAPAVIAAGPESLERAIGWAIDSSRTTHAALACIESCGLFGELLWKAMHADGDPRNGGKAELLFKPFVFRPATPSLQSIAAGDYRPALKADIRSTGFVVDTLRAALWAFWNTESFCEAVRLAVSLGGDADTVGAVTGQLAGAYYGLDTIPASWLSSVLRFDISKTVVALMHDLIALGESRT